MKTISYVDAGSKRVVMFGEESNVDVDVSTKKNIEQQNVETAPIVNVSQRNVNKLETRGNVEQEQK